MLGSFKKCDFQRDISSERRNTFPFKTDIIEDRFIAFELI